MSGTLSPERAAFAQRDYIYNLIKAQVNVGVGGVPGTGTNSAGTLQAVATLGRKTIWPGFAKLPFVGVSLDMQTEDLYATQRSHVIDTFFKVGISVRIDATEGAIIQVDDGIDELEALCDDGAGNGVGPIIRANSAYNLGTTGSQYNAEMNYVPKIEYGWDKNAVAKGVTYFAYAIYTIRGKVHLHVGH